MILAVLLIIAATLLFGREKMLDFIAACFALAICAVPVAAVIWFVAQLVRAAGKN